jgi:hypothetical protein
VLSISTVFEPLGVVGELVELDPGAADLLALLERVKHAGPRAVAGRRVVPARSADAKVMGESFRHGPFSRKRRAGRAMKQRPSGGGR